MQTDRTQAPARPQRILRLAFMACAMLAIFVLDTATRYEVAVAVFYTAVILTTAGILERRQLIALAAGCCLLTLLSFALTPHGDHASGLVNLAISLAAIMVTSYLLLKMEAARGAAHEAQAQLLRLARVKSLEGLTTSIAHEINQPLAAIVTSGNACQRWLNQEPANLERARQALERILGDAGRASNIIARVRGLSRGAPPAREVFDLNQAILDLLALSRSELERHDIHLALDLGDDLPAALADRIQIQQVMGNLLLNAIEALTSTVPTRRAIHIASTLRDGMLWFAIHDSGHGFPDGVLEHLFEAFWTTKEQGIGIGLSLSRTIVEANGGQILAESGDDSGATFRFSLPLATGHQP